MDVARYLGRIGVAGPGAPGAAALARLHEAHLLAIPFENLAIAWAEPIVLDERWLFRKIVEEGRGGGCYELNALFAWGLRALGYPVDLLAARVRREDGGFGPPFDHMCLRVRADGRAWLADVGFGDSFRRPLPLEDGAALREGLRTYALRRAGDELELVRREGGGEWVAQYRVALAGTSLQAFGPMLEVHRSSPESPFAGRRVCTVATRWGRLTLSGRTLVRTALDGGRAEEAIADEAAWEAALRAHFGIEPHRPRSAAPPA